MTCYPGSVALFPQGFMSEKDVAKVLLWLGRNGVRDIIVHRDDNGLPFMFGGYR